METNAQMRVANEIILFSVTFRRYIPRSIVSPPFAATKLYCLYMGVNDFLKVVPQPRPTGSRTHRLI